MLQKNIVLLFAVLLFPACGLLFDYEPVRFTVSGDAAVMTGVIDGNIVEELETLLDRHPQIRTIIMQNVEGSVDDEANIEAARLVRERGLNTLFPGSGIIASGGTDFSSPG